MPFLSGRTSKSTKSTGKRHANRSTKARGLAYVHRMKLARKNPASLFAEHVEPFVEPMRLAAGVSGDDFRAIYVPHLARVCRCLQQAPLSRLGYPLPDGAVRFVAHSATLALQLAQAAVFAADLGATARRDLSRQYRFATFAAVVGTAYIRVFRNVRFMVEGSPWNPLSEVGLYDYSEKSGEYEIAWHPDKYFPPSASLDAMVFMSAFQPGFWERFHPLVLQDMAGGLSPAKDIVSESPMQRLLRTAAERVFEVESNRIAQNVESSASIPAFTSAAVAAAEIPVGASQPQAHSPPAPSAPSLPDQPGSSTAPPKYPKRVRDLFEAIKRDEKFPEIREAMKVTHESVGFPLKYLNRYTLKASDVVQILESAGLALSKNDSHIVLRPEAAKLLGLEGA